MLTELRGPGRLALGALIGSALAALVGFTAVVDPPSPGPERSDVGHIVVVRGSEQPGRTAGVAGTAAPEGTATSTTTTTSSSTTAPSSSTTSVTSTTTTSATTTTATTTTRPTTTRPTTTTTTTTSRRPTTTTTTTTTRRPCGLIFC
ncbi:hypothetical protein [Saccharothrix syringae]|uniref:hypothetical protein n=1 Tax=Saccharothrix syringae TaxID=103733 RepID=UPI000A701C39|nr:hypothetical protein [Saccharothrix syringae]